VRNECNEFPAKYQIIDINMKRNKFQVIKDAWGRMDERATHEAFEI